MDVTGAIPTAMVTDYGWRQGNYDCGNRIDHDTILRGLSDIRMEAKETEADIRMETKETEAVLLRTAAANAAVIAKDSCDSTYRLHNSIHHVGDQVLASANLTQSLVASTSCATQAAIAAASSAALLAGERQTAAILAALSATELRQVQDKLNETRLECSGYKSHINFGDQFSAIQSQIYKLDQIQRSTNQAINFGSGRIGEQTSTSNQVR
jgi:hypothetical protein